MILSAELDERCFTDVCPSFISGGLEVCICVVFWMFLGVMDTHCFSQRCGTLASLSISLVGALVE
jgi:hypothetical protein